MDLRRLLELFFAVSVIVGLVVAPLAASAKAEQPRAPGMTMSADMPCCPDEQKSKDCQDCPLVALCVLKNAQAGPSSTEALPLRHAVRSAHSVYSDVLADGLDRPPPDHPPRNLI